MWQKNVATDCRSTTAFAIGDRGLSAALEAEQSMVRKMHADEVETDALLARRLLSVQFPKWADLPVEPVPSAGTDNALFRLGDERVIRLPRIHWAVAQVKKEQQWLPKLAPHLPLAIPLPLAQGQPGEGYPWHWSIYRWIDGATATLAQMADPHQTAIDLAEFIADLHRIDTTDGPSPGPHNSGRGAPLTTRDAQTRAAIAALGDLVDIDAVTEAWESALRAPAWTGPPVWVHGDLHSGNLLAQQGRLTAVIDFGCLDVGDPASDVMAAWLYLSADTRALFRTALQVDDATWARGRGWALSMGLIALPYYQQTNPALAAIAQRAIDEALADHSANG
ncbi:MAG: aminoglycoside phosphotransferase family protein [Caldilineaceae bacterium]|nr:aminoglycoside phosphotransferase family protein [Caldilineaceae bacterium]